MTVGINPHADATAATHWADQFGAEVIEEAQALLETVLHNQGLCTAESDETTLTLLECALEAGAVTMATLLEKHGRIKEGK